MSDDAAFPRDDRAWPRGAFTFSVVCGIASLAVSAALLVKADSAGRMFALGVTFVVAAALEASAYVAGIRPWLAGKPIPRQVEVAQAGLVLLALLAFAAGPEFGGVALCGLFAGAFLPNAGLIRYARVNREMAAAEGEQQLAQAQAQAGPNVQPAPDDELSELMPRGPAPQVGRVLRAELVEERGELLAWVLAAVVAVLACVAAGETEAPLTAVVLVALGALFYVGRRLYGVWRALRDYEKSETEPRRAYVALLNDPNARVTRPLLGLWNEEPMTQGRLPRAEAVYRCDEERSALMSPPGRVIVHEAWVDTGKHSGLPAAMGGGRRRSRPAAPRRCPRQVVPRLADRLRAADRGATADRAITAPGHRAQLGAGRHLDQRADSRVRQMGQAVRLASCRPAGRGPDLHLADLRNPSMTSRQQRGQNTWKTTEKEQT